MQVKLKWDFYRLDDHEIILKKISTSAKIYLLTFKHFYLGFFLPSFYSAHWAQLARKRAQVTNWTVISSTTTALLSCRKTFPTQEGSLGKWTVPLWTR